MLRIFVVVSTTIFLKNIIYYASVHYHAIDLMITKAIQIAMIMKMELGNFHH